MTLAELKERLNKLPSGMDDQEVVVVIDHPDSCVVINNIYADYRIADGATQGGRPVISIWSNGNGYEADPLWYGKWDKNPGVVNDFRNEEG